jgi:hypothetical protein
MFNQKPQLDIADFLEAVGFVSPPNFKVDYFVVPRGDQLNLPENSGFSTRQDLPEDETITYHQTPPVEKHDIAEDPAEYSIWEAGPLGKRLATPHPLPKVTDPSELKSPFVQMIHEARASSITFRLKEDVYPFKRGTLFHCVPNRIKESR